MKVTTINGIKYDVWTKEDFVWIEPKSVVGVKKYRGRRERLGLDASERRVFWPWEVNA